MNAKTVNLGLSYLNLMIWACIRLSASLPVYTKTPKFNSCWHQQKKCWHCTMPLWSMQTSLRETQWKRPDKLFQYYEVRRRVDLHVYRTLFKLVKRSLITLKQCKYSLTKICVWSQIEFLYNFRVAVLQPLCCTESTCKFQMNVCLSLAIPIYIMQVWNYRRLKS